LWQVGEIIRMARRERKLSQQELARRAGVSRSTLSDLERGRCIELGWMKLERLVLHLGLELQIVRPVRHRPTLDELRLENEAEERKLSNLGV